MDNIKKYYNLTASSEIPDNDVSNIMLNDNFCWKTDSSLNHWIIIELETATIVRSLSIRWGDKKCDILKVRLSNDQKKWDLGSRYVRKSSTIDNINISDDYKKSKYKYIKIDFEYIKPKIDDLGIYNISLEDDKEQLIYYLCVVASFALEHH